MADHSATGAALPFPQPEVHDSRLLAAEHECDVAIVLAQPLMRRGIARHLRAARPHAHGTFQGVAGHLEGGQRVLVFEAPALSTHAVAAATWQARMLCPDLKLIAYAGRAVRLDDPENSAGTILPREAIALISFLQLPSIVMRRDDPHPTDGAELWKDTGQVDIAGSRRWWRLDDGVAASLPREACRLHSQGQSMVTLSRCPSSPLEWDWVAAQAKALDAPPRLADLGASAFAYALTNSATLPPGHPAPPPARVAVVVERDFYGWPLSEAAPRGVDSGARLRALDEQLAAIVQWIEAELDTALPAQL